MVRSEAEADVATRAASECVVELSDVTIAFRTKGDEDQPFVAVKGIDLQVPSGQFLAVVGPSGCGKTTILNLLAGLISPSAGTAKLFGKAVNGPSKSVGYMLARAALSPWRTAKKNVEIGLELRGVSRRERTDIALSLLDRLGIMDFADAYPSQLSNGMQQRVAIARTLAIDPALWLMDEPFGALDAQTRLVVQSEFVSLWEGTGKTVLFVTHDLTEAVLLADRVIVMSQGGPGRITMDTLIDLPRPRQLADLRFDSRAQALEEHIWEELRNEFT